MSALKAVFFAAFGLSGAWVVCGAAIGARADSVPAQNLPSRAPETQAQSLPTVVPENQVPALAPAQAQSASAPLQDAPASPSSRSFLIGDAETSSSIKIEEPPVHTSASSDQLFSLSVGYFVPESVSVGNGTYRFDYGSRPSTYQAQAAWGLKLFEAGGGFYFQAALAFSSLSGNAVQPDAGGSGSGLSASSYTLGLLGIDGRLAYNADWLPWHWLVPFGEAGCRYTVYYQPGSSGLDAAEGGVGNPVAAAGLRFWLNRRASMSGSTPWFLMAKVERLFPQDSSLNLASTSAYGGITLGL